MSNKIIEIKQVHGHKELFLFGVFQATFPNNTSDEEVIYPYAIERAVEIGAGRKAEEIRKALGVSYKEHKIF